MVLSRERTTRYIIGNNYNKDKKKCLNIIYPHFHLPCKLKRPSTKWATAFHSKPSPLCKRSNIVRLRKIFSTSWNVASIIFYVIFVETVINILNFSPKAVKHFWNSDTEACRVYLYTEQTTRYEEGSYDTAWLQRNNRGLVTGSIRATPFYSGTLFKKHNLAQNNLSRSHIWTLTTVKGGLFAWTKNNNASILIGKLEEIINLRQFATDWLPCPNSALEELAHDTPLWHAIACFGEIYRILFTLNLLLEFRAFFLFKELVYFTVCGTYWEGMNTLWICRKFSAKLSKTRIFRCSLLNMAMEICQSPPCCLCFKLSEKKRLERR